MRKGEKVRVALIGFGYWGPNLLRNLLRVRDAEVVGVADESQQHLNELPFLGKNLLRETNGERLLESDEVDAAVIATPASTHFALARKALQAGKHLLVEKPLATTVKEGAALLSIAKEKKLVLMTGHTFLYNMAVRQLRKYIEGGELGNIYYLYAQRLNLGRVRQDVNALWNFAPHDLSILLYLLGKMPESVSAKGFSFLQKGIEDVVFMTLSFSGEVGAHVHISWIDPHKVRRLTVVGSRKMAIYDDVSVDRKITLYDRGLDRIPRASQPRDFQTFAEFQLVPRKGDVVIPSFDFPEPLFLECQHFVECITKDSVPLTNGQQGCQVVQILEAASQSLRLDGEPVRVADATY